MVTSLQVDRSAGIVSASSSRYIRSIAIAVSIRVIVVVFVIVLVRFALVVTSLDITACCSLCGFNVNVAGLVAVCSCSRGGVVVIVVLSLALMVTSLNRSFFLDRASRVASRCVGVGVGIGIGVCCVGILCLALVVTRLNELVTSLDINNGLIGGR